MEKWKKEVVRCNEGRQLWLCSLVVEALNDGVCHLQRVLAATEQWLSSDRASVV